MSSPLDDLDIDRLFGPAEPPDSSPDPFGRIGSGDPDWERVREAWMAGAPLKDLFGGTPFDLQGSVGINRDNRRGDVFKLQSLLHREGHLDAEATGGPTGYWGGRDDAALRGLQRENGLTVDGWAAPRGETIGWLRDLYKPPHGVQVSDTEMKSLETSRTLSRDLAVQLGLDPDAIDLTNPAVLPALGAVNFIRYATGRAREASLQKVQALRASDPKLAGRLQALAAEIISQPQWHYDKMTPEELQRARKLLDAGDVSLKEFEKALRPFLRGVPKAVDRYIFRPTQKIVVDQERRRLDRELERRRDPRDR